MGMNPSTISYHFLSFECVCRSLTEHNIADQLHLPSTFQLYWPLSKINHMKGNFNVGNTMACFLPYLNQSVVGEMTIPHLKMGSSSLAINAIIMVAR